MQCFSSACFTFLVNPGKVVDSGALRSAWIVFLLIPLSQVVVLIIKGSHLKSPRGLVVVEPWSNGIVWLLFAVSIYRLIGALIPGQGQGRPKIPNEQ
ncbi:MAG: hypothetical protein VCA37_09865 [Roseibacillus sp.]